MAKKVKYIIVYEQDDEQKHTVVSGAGPLEAILAFQEAWESATDTERPEIIQAMPAEFWKEPEKEAK